MPAFISYSQKDEAIYTTLCMAMDYCKIERWDSTTMQAGAPLAGQLREAIDRCETCVFIATRNSTESQWCLAELGAFWGAGKTVILFIVDANLTESALPPQFKGSLTASSAPKLIDTVKEVIRSYRKINSSPKTVAKGIRITAPINNAEVDVVTVTGTITEPVPRGYRLRTVRIYPEVRQFLPFGLVVCDEQNNTWECAKFDVGGKTGDKREIGIFLVGPSGNALLDYFQQAAMIHNPLMREFKQIKERDADFLPNIDESTIDAIEDMIECHRVNVKRS